MGYPFASRSATRERPQSTRNSQEETLNDSPMTLERVPTRVFACSTMIMLLLMIMMERTIHSLFVVSLEALGLNITLLAIPALFTGFIYPSGLSKSWPHSRRILDGFLLISLLATVLVQVATKSATVIASAVSVVTLTPLLFESARRLGARALGPCTLAALLFCSLRILNWGASPGLTHRGVWLLMVVVVSTAACWLWARGDFGASRSAKGVSGLPAIMAFLLLESQLLASPSVVSTLHSLPGGEWFTGPEAQLRWLLLLVAGSQLGLALGYHQGSRSGRFALWPRVGVMGGLQIVCLSALIFGFAFRFAPVVLNVAQVSAVVLLSSALRSSGSDRIGLVGAAVGLTQLVWMSLVLAHALARNWPFLPNALGRVLRGQAPALFLASCSLLAVIALLASRRTEAANA